MASIYRLVESQEQIATLELVHDVYEQGILEDLLESTKSPLPHDTKALHYLLQTPFRYPPLKYGSRFGTAYERGLFYGSLSTSTALAETAYYRFVYMLGPEMPFSETIHSEYTSFSASIRTHLALFLDKEPFIAYESLLMSKNSYVATQQLGHAMRNFGIEAFQFVSARDKLKGKNIALFTPNAFCNSNPVNLTTWLCQTNTEQVGFMSKDKQNRVLYKQEDFWVDNTFPSPAT